MKRLRYMRHGWFDKETGGLPQSELDLVGHKVPKEKYTDIIYSPVYRVTQTALAVVAGLDFEVRVHEPLDEMLNESPTIEILEKIFDRVSKGGFGLAIGHSIPVERMLLLCFNRKIRLRYLGFVDFVQSDDDKIRVAGWS